MLIEDVIARIRAYRVQAGWSKARFALEAGLTVNALRDMDSAGWSPTADTLRKLESIIPEDWKPDEEAA